MIKGHRKLRDRRQQGASLSFFDAFIMGCKITYFGFHCLASSDSRADSALILSTKAIASTRITIKGHWKLRERHQQGTSLNFCAAFIMGCKITYLGFHCLDSSDSRADSALILPTKAIASTRITVQGHRKSREW
jgi:hypothetical protein